MPAARVIDAMVGSFWLEGGELPATGELLRLLPPALREGLVLHGPYRALRIDLCGIDPGKNDPREIDQKGAFLVVEAFEELGMEEVTVAVGFALGMKLGRAEETMIRVVLDLLERVIGLRWGGSMVWLDNGVMVCI